MSGRTKSLTSQPKRVARPEVSKWVKGAAPLSPRITACQKASAVCPRGVTAPRPVTTTRWGWRGIVMTVSRTVSLQTCRQTPIAWRRIVRLRGC